MRGGTAGKTVRRNNTSGVPGVDWWAAKGTWRATICFKGKRLYLSSYRRFEGAETCLHDRFLQDCDAETAQQGPSV
ncbi:MAG: hypothetical protein K2O45_03090 [Oscillospiraceae bacterium]|nr:hypothetical protein [Oscillospiraceae bacterium]